MKVDRFQVQKAKRECKFRLQPKSVLIKDHSDDRYVCIVNMFNDIDNNEELGNAIITAIEEFLGGSDGE